MRGLGARRTPTTAEINAPKLGLGSEKMKRGLGSEKKSLHAIIRVRASKAMQVEKGIMRETQRGQRADEGTI
jgi:hypothetical protein